MSLMDYIKIYEELEAMRLKQVNNFRIIMELFFKQSKVSGDLYLIF